MAQQVFLVLFSAFYIGVGFALGRWWRHPVTKEGTRESFDLARHAGKVIASRKARVFSQKTKPKRNADERAWLVENDRSGGDEE